eukprot:CAMPEP_0201717880 /NCGR_PEP_ID=MMETSP0593-20130828/3546_1 /ASSEMBLY_ACC=CAM_ASM_000672 /TAXON_ID=267983 /ORGANISM="Skeletonema japonicum, Strain CCMP2506" /LENGTH=289 /DNA_ID=CAMNT_0048208055 /DNA_START=48 /DNA_END=917 /DNA_ORIENTATION=-
MAPQQPVDFDEWDDDEMIVPSAQINSSCAPQSQDCDCELGEAQSSSAAELKSTSLMTPKKVLPPSILRRRLSPAQQQASLSSPPSHWPKRQRVDFADGPRRTISASPPSVVTAIYYRPRTPVADIPSLYYSALDVKNFKREFRALLRSQKLARQRLQQNSEERLSSTDNISDAAHSQERTTTVQHHDNSFWRSKVSRWSAQTKATSAAVADPSSSCINRASSQINDDCDDDVDSPSSAQGGIFSSVFDVAREAASLFGTSSSGSSSAYYQKDRAPQQNQIHLIDTLYLF